MPPSPFKFIIWIILLFMPVCTLAQPERSYRAIAQRGDSLLKIKAYDKALILYRKNVERAPAEYKGEFLLKTGSLLHQREEYQTALEYWKKAHDHGVNTSDKDLQARALINMGAYHTRVGSLVEGVDHYTNALEILKELENDTLIAVVSFNRALTYKEKGQYDKAIQDMFQAINNFEKLEFINYIAKCHQTLGNIFREVKKDSLSLVYHNKALNFYNKHQNNRAIASVLNDMGNTYKQLYDLDNALRYYKRSMQVGDSAFNPTTYGNIAEVYEMKGEYPNAEKYYQHSIKLRKAQGDFKAFAYTLSALGGLYVKSEQYEQAKIYLKEASKISGEKEYLDVLVEVFKSRQLLHEKQGNIDTAYYFLKNQMDLKEKIFNKSSQEIIEQLSLEFSIPEMVREKEQYKEESRLNRILAQKERRAKIAYLVAAALFVVTALVLAYAFYQSRKYGRWQQVQKIEVQHRTKNHLQTLNDLFQFQLHSEDDLKTKAAIQQSQNRVSAIMMINQSLTHSQSGNVDFTAYVRQLVELIRSGFKEEIPEVKISWTGDNITLNADEATLAGLIINELVHNAFKYGLKPQYDPELQILMKTEKGALQVEIADNGPGISEVMNKNKGSKGLGLVNLFARQLKGTLEMENKNGTRVKVKLKVKPAT